MQHPPIGAVCAVTCVLVEKSSAQQAAHAFHKKGRKACQEPKTGPRRLAPKVGGKTVQSDFLREKEGNIHRPGQRNRVWREACASGTSGRKRRQPTNRTANVYATPPPPKKLRGSKPPHRPGCVSKGWGGGRFAGRPTSLQARGSWLEWRLGPPRRFDCFPFTTLHHSWHGSWPEPRSC